MLFAIATYTGLELRRGASGASLPSTFVQRESEQRLARALGLSALGVSIGAILCGTVLFFVFPRISAGYLGKTSFNPSLLSGFTDQVELGQIGQIKKSDAIVMRVETGKPINYPALRWRGNALANFDGRRWSLPQSEPEKLESNAEGWIPLRERPKAGELRGKSCNLRCCRSRWPRTRCSCREMFWPCVETSRARLAVSAVSEPISTATEADLFQIRFTTTSQFAIRDCRNCRLSSGRV